ncbi:DNA translocase FtsK 4TM domain-containing protein [Desulforhopalus sp. IMCC35007]|uniref:FtsK/SpoIIIE family DNA translocase n=1 Tax=Desulforhopalus sp. IMCC35007 TaxID=2569543 RepID=UPI0010AE9D00|nr:DNA translocase FtsK 4TM domain-containing protein [Desulforhopalus sp. IMCC35007]TKB08752.1 cell division protein FtsK [Desulforhopalus sp. IMCC35007]
MAQKNEPPKPGLKQEALAVLGISLSLFLYLSLFAYIFKFDANWSGKVGSVIAEVLFGFIGWGAYLLPTLLLISSFLFFGSKISFQRLPHVIAGLTGAIISFCGLLSSFTIHDSSYLGAGGFLGKTGFVLLDAVVGHGGTVLVFLMVFLISLMLSAQFSPYQVLVMAVQLIKKLSTSAMNNRREKKMVRERRSPQVRKAEVYSESPVVQGPVVQVPVAESSAVPVVKESARSNKASAKDEEFAAMPVARGDWKLPPLSLLNSGEQVHEKIDKEVYYQLSKELEQKLENFGVSGKVVGISPGPVVTTYEYSPAPGVKINKIAGLADDLALGLKAQSVRVVGSVPGKAALGIEIPNDNRQIVYIRELIGAKQYRSGSHKLAIALGLDVVGNLSMANLAKMPHLLIAGATGAGKSVGINTIIASILYNATPEEVRFLMVDPKRIELSGYEGIPHLLHPVVVDPKLASRALNWAVREMERRYRLLEEAKVKSFDSYNQTNTEKLPYIVVIVDELADLMMVASKDVEAAIARLAQMARAAGIHMILATQRPSVDVLTGLIKANFPTRISFKVSSKIDSRTILDASGAEHLLGAGDMLFLAPGTSSIKRIHGAYISEKETSDIVDFWKNQGNSTYDEGVMKEIEKDDNPDGGAGEEDFDDRYDEAVAIVTEAGQASISMVQRRLRVGYNRAARMIETMEKEGIVGPADGAKPREVIVRNDYS